MSEINSIAQGTYTLGQTSATTYQAGPGISITQPSEGTVRISNDETVLFEDNAGHTGNFTTTEPLSAFNEVAVYVSPDLNSDGPSKIVIPMIGRNTSNFKFGWIGTFNGWKNVEWQFVYNNTAMTSFQPVSGAYFGRNSNTQITGGDWNTNSMYMYKIIGIGRKQ